MDCLVNSMKKQTDMQKNRQKLVSLMGASQYLIPYQPSELIRLQGGLSCLLENPNDQANDYDRR
jgi:hypothetical protein